MNVAALGNLYWRYWEPRRPLRMLGRVLFLKLKQSMCHLALPHELVGAVGAACAAFGVTIAVITFEASITLSL